MRQGWHGRAQSFLFFFVFHPVIFSEFSNTVLGDVHFQEKPMAGCRQNEHIFEGGGAHCFTDSFLFLFFGSFCFPFDAMAAVQAGDDL